MIGFRGSGKIQGDLLVRISVSSCQYLSALSAHCQPVTNALPPGNFDAQRSLSVESVTTRYVSHFQSQFLSVSVFFQALSVAISSADLSGLLDDGISHGQSR